MAIEGRGLGWVGGFSSGKGQKMGKVGSCCWIGLL